MTLFDFLQKQSKIHMDQAFYYLNRSDNEFYRSLGHIDMCNKMCELLSDETLKMEVKTRTEVMNTPEKKSDGKLYKYTYPF